MNLTQLLLKLTILKRLRLLSNVSISILKEFYLGNLLDKLSKERKTVFLLGDLNIILLNYDQDNPTNEFLVSLSTHLFLTHKLQQTRVSDKYLENSNRLYIFIINYYYIGNIPQYDIWYYHFYVRSLTTISHIP